MYDLLQIMQQDGYLSSVELLALRKTCKELGENPVRMLRSLNIASPEQIQDYLQRYFGVGALGKQALKMLDETYQSFVPVDIAIHYSCFGLGEDSNVLYVAMEDPSDRGIVNQLRFFLNKRIVGVSATVFQLAEGLSKIYKVHKSALNLTTILENTRGVIAGIRYEVPHKVEAISIDDDFVSSNLKDSDSQDDEPVVAKKSAKQPDKVIGSEAPEAEAEAKESNSGAEPSAEISVASEGSEADKMPSVGFIDGSSGEVDNTALTEENPSAEVAAGETETPMEASAGEETPIVEEAPQEIAEDSPQEIAAKDEPVDIDSMEEPQELDLEAADDILADDVEMESEEYAPHEKTFETPTESMTVQLSSLASSALVKLSLIDDKDQAVEMINSLLKPFNTSVTLFDAEKYLIEGEDFSVEGDLTSEIRAEGNSVAFAIEPILKRVLKMKDEL